MKIRFIMPKEISAYLQMGAQFIDLRDVTDYKEHHIKRAVSMPYEEFEKNFRKLPKNRTYVLYCERGATSMLAAKKMQEAGYDVYSLSGGMHAVHKQF